MRIGGLASGMDIDQIVGDLMRAERIPLDKLKQNKQVLEWQRDDYRSINTLLLNFRSELTNMKLSSTYRARTTTTTDDAKVTATATSAAGKAAYTISKVDRLATSAYKIGGGGNNVGISKTNTDKIDPSKSLYEIKGQFADETFDWKIGSVESKTVTLDEKKNTAKITLDGGAKILTDRPVSIKVNGKAYTVVTGTPEPLKNEVKVEENGTLTFGDILDKGSIIKAEFIADKRVDTAKISKDNKEFQLTKGSITDEVTIKVGDKNYIGKPVGDGKSLNIYLNVNGDVSGDPVGSIDAATGKVKLPGISNDVFKSQEEGEPDLKEIGVTVEYKQNYFTFGLKTATSKGTVNETFFVQGTESLNQVIAKVNNSPAGITMFYDSVTDKATLTRSEQGRFSADGQIEGEGITPATQQIDTTGSNFLNKVLQFESATGENGQNAKFTINGLETYRSSNTFSMNGVTFTLKQTFTSSTPVSISINNDSQKVFENIKGFVDKYNELIGAMNKKLTEERYRSYTPLTDQQRESLSDKQQEQWEEKAKSGLLKRDPILSQALSSMRMDFYAPVQNEGINPLYKQLASIGIKTTANYLEGGKLEINEAELKKAIEADPEGVEKLFNASGTEMSQKGIAQRLTDSVNAVMDKLKEKAGNAFSTNQQFAIGRNLNDLNNRIDRFEDRMKQVEDRYWRQFTAMEKAIQRANQQSAYLMQQFNSGN